MFAILALIVIVVVATLAIVAGEDREQSSTGRSILNFLAWCLLIIGGLFLLVLGVCAIMIGGMH
jgi:uncharacterized membrane protein YhhN